MFSAVVERTEASPATLIAIGVTFALIGMLALWARSYGYNFAGTVAPVLMIMLALAIMLFGIVLLLS